MSHIVVLNWKDPAHPFAGGAEVYTHQCARRWVQAGHRVTWVSAGVKGKTDDTLDNIQMVRAGSKFTVYRHAKKWVTSQKPGSIDYVLDEVNTRGFNTPVWLHERHPSTKLLALAHQTAEEVWGYQMPFGISHFGRYVAEPWWWSAYKNTPIAVPSQSSYHTVQAFGPQNVHVLPVGVLPPPSSLFDYGVPSKASVPTVVIPGRLVAMKRTNDAIVAFLKAVESTPGLVNAHCHVVGTGPDLKKYQKQYEHIPNVTIHGYVSNADRWSLMAKAHVLLACGAREGWGLVVSEGASVGTYPIGYDSFGLIDSVSAAQGSLVPEGSIDLLAKELSVKLLEKYQTPASPMPYGGAHSWDTVAEVALTALVSQSLTSVYTYPLKRQPKFRRSMSDTRHNVLTTV